MKQLKKLTALLLAAACLCALVCVPPASAAQTVSTFPDVTDPQVGRAVEALRTMGVIDGSDGLYRPQDSLTRAAFCKMAILVMGRGDEADAQAGRTIFNDVPGSHWARGYVNLAATTAVGASEDGKGGSRLMMGLGNGSFAPDRPVTYGEAVTTLLRILGYTKEANANWPSGAVSTAAMLGLTDGFTAPQAGETLTRAQAAVLFCNMLTAPVSGAKDTTYLASQGCQVEAGALLLDCDATQNGITGYVKVFGADGIKEPVLAAVRSPASFLEGTRGTAVYDQRERFLTFLPDAGDTSRTITVASVSGGVLTAADGTKYTPSSTCKVWKGDTYTEYAAAYPSIQPGTSVTICYTAAGAIEYLFLHGTSMSLTGGVMVARENISGNPFAQLTGGTSDYKIVKNGADASLSDLERYDVAAFDPTNKTLYVTNFRLTGIYESASPNTTMPTKLRISLFDQELDVLDSAADDLKSLKLGSSITLLLSPDGKVAGAVSSTALRANTVGYVDGGALKLVGAPAELPDVTIPSTSSINLDLYRDSLFSVAGAKSGRTNIIRLTRLSNKTGTDTLNVKNRTLGGAPLADNVAVFDRIANSCIAQVELSDITMSTVPPDKIAYQRTNAAGKVDLLVLNDVTGNLYTYGICKTGETPEQTFGDGDDQISFTNRTTSVLTAAQPTVGDSPLTVVGGTTYSDNQFIGMVKSINKLSGTDLSRPAASVLLRSVYNASPGSFNLETGIFFSGSLELPIWDGVQCYNAQTKKWFTGTKKVNGTDVEKSSMELLRDCLAYSSNLTVYYDRDPGQGGKVRIVVAN